MSFNVEVRRIANQIRHTCDNVEYGSLCEDPYYLEFEMKTILRQTKLGKTMMTGVSGNSVIITDGSPFTKRLEVYWDSKSVMDGDWVEYRLKGDMYVQSTDGREWVKNDTFTGDWSHEDYISTVYLRDMLREMWGLWAGPLFEE